VKKNILSGAAATKERIEGAMLFDLKDLEKTLNS